MLSFKQLLLVTSCFAVLCVRAAAEVSEFDEDEAAPAVTVGSQQVNEPLEGAGLPTPAPAPRLPMSVALQYKDWTIEILTGVAAFAIIALYVVGRSQSSSTVSKLNEILRPLLREQFSAAGSGSSIFTATSSTEFEAWCSGRRNCKGLLLDLALKNRTDFVTSIISAVMPQATATAASADMLTFEIPLDDSVPSFILAILPRKDSKAVIQSCLDLKNIPEKTYSAGDFQLPAELDVVTDHREVLNEVVPAATKTFISSNVKNFRQLYITDFATMPDAKDPSNTYRLTTASVSSKTLRFTVQLPSQEQWSDFLPSLVRAVFALVDSTAAAKFGKDAASAIKKHRDDYQHQLDAIAQKELAETRKKEKEEKARKEREDKLKSMDKDARIKFELKERKRLMQEQQGPRTKVVRM